MAFCELWLAVLCLLHSAGRIESFPAPPAKDESCGSIPNSETFTYHDEQYIVFYDTVTWDEASAICPTYSAGLATINTMPKAMALAEALSESNRRISEVWLGARKLSSGWTWVGLNTPLNSTPGLDDFPPWVYVPDRAGKECLAMDRKGHSGPAFLDMMCSQLKPFICERNKDAASNGPQETRTIRSGESMFTLYNGRLDWFGAIAHCRKLGKRLAILNNPSKISDLSQAMTKSRPAFETAWIGGKFTYGSWMWAPTGEKIPDFMDPTTLYPPWKKRNSTRAANGCLLLDRYLCEEGLFYDTNCLRTRDFICEQSISETKHDNTTVTRYRYENKTYEILTTNLTWSEAMEVCKVKTGHLARVPDSGVLDFVIDLMAEDTTMPLNHMWVGGELVNGTWTWADTEEEISIEKGGAAWCESTVHVDMPCLNLDRTDQNQPALYGLECNNTQPALCQVDCNDPPEVPNGMWTCTPVLSDEERICTLECDANYRVFGSSYFRCSEDGWIDLLNRNIAPECLTPEDLGNLLLDKLLVQTQHDNITSILFIVEDSQNVTEETRAAVMALINSIVQAIPLSESLRAGVTMFGSRVMQLLPLNNINSCTIARDMSPAQEKRVLGKANYESALLAIQQQTNKYNMGKHSIVVIFAATDPEPEITSGLYEELKNNGHVFYVIASNETSSLTHASNILKLATVGPDESFNAMVLGNSIELSQVSAVIGKRRSLELDCNNAWQPRGNQTQGGEPDPSSQNKLQ